MALRIDMQETAWSQRRHLEASQVVWVSKKAGTVVAVAEDLGREGQVVGVSRPIVGQEDCKERVERLLSLDHWWVVGIQDKFGVSSGRAV